MYRWNGVSSPAMVAGTVAGSERRRISSPTCVQYSRTRVWPSAVPLIISAASVGEPSHPTKKHEVRSDNPNELRDFEVR